MNPEFSFPVMLSLEGKKCLIVGAGKVGQRKLGKILLSRPKKILVLDIRPCPEIEKIMENNLDNGIVKYENRACTEQDVRESFLVCVATDNMQINIKIATWCKNLNVLCNCASAPSMGSFILPAHKRWGNLSLMISTNASSPALAKKWLDEHNSWMNEKEFYLAFMKKIRKLVLSEELLTNNSSLFYKIIQSPFEEWLLMGEWEKCSNFLKCEMPEYLHHKIDKLFHDLP